MLDCGQRTTTRRIEESRIFDIWSLVVDLRRCVDTSSSAQLAGLDVAAAQCGTGGFILDACGPARPVLAACRACEAWLRELAGRESSHREDTRAGVKYRGFFPSPQILHCVAHLGPIWTLVAIESTLRTLSAVSPPACPTALEPAAQPARSRRSGEPVDGAASGRR